MSRFAFFVCTLALTALLTIPAYSIMAPPAEIVDADTSHPCLKLSPGLIFGVLPGYGTGDKGPAVQLHNNCGEAVIVRQITLSDNLPAAPQSAQEHKGYIKTQAGQHTDYFYLAGDGQRCRNIPPKSKTRVRCTSVYLPAEGSLVFGVPWEKHFTIEGHSDHLRINPARQGFSVTGKMIDPSGDGGVFR